MFIHYISSIYKVFVSSIELSNITYINMDAGNETKKINLILNAEIPTNSAIPPQTPKSDLYLEDLLSFFKCYILPFI